MANNIKIGVETAIYKGQFDHDAKAIENRIKELSSTPLLVKMKFDKNDPLKAYVDEYKKAVSNIRKAYGISKDGKLEYKKGTNGKTVGLNTEEQIKAAIKEATTMIERTTGDEKRMWGKRLGALEERNRAKDAIRGVLRQDKLDETARRQAKQSIEKAKARREMMLADPEYQEYLRQKANGAAANADLQNINNGAKRFKEQERARQAEKKRQEKYDKDVRANIDKEVAADYAAEKKEKDAKQKEFDKARKKFLKEGEAPAESEAERKAREAIEENKVRLELENDKRRERADKERKRFEDNQSARLSSLKAVEKATYYDKNGKVDENKKIQEQIKLVNALAQAEEARYAKTNNGANKLKAENYRKKLQSLRDELQLNREIKLEEERRVSTETAVAHGIQSMNKSIDDQYNKALSQRQKEFDKARKKFLREGEDKSFDRVAQNAEDKQVERETAFQNIVERQRREQERVRTEQEKVNKALENEKKLLKEIANERKNNAKNGGKNTKSIEEQIRLYKRLAVEAKNAGDAQTRTYAERKKTELETYKNSLKSINRIYNGQNRLLTRLRSLAANYFSIYAVKNFVVHLSEVTGYFQQQQIALEGILGSASKAQQVLSDIKSFAVQSPFQTKELVGFTKQLSAYGIEADKLFPTVKQLADISAGLGVDMSRIILAYGQVRSASVLRGQELRQFTEAGIPMVDALAKKFTELNGELTTSADIFDKISKRQVSFEMVAEVLSDMASEGGKFYKMQENLTNTMAGQISKLKDMWTLALNDMGGSVGKIILAGVKGLQGAVKNAVGVLVGGSIAVSLMSIVSKVRELTHEFNNFTEAQKKAAGGLKGFVLNGLKLAGVSALLSAASVAFGVLIGYIANAIYKAGELQRKFDEIHNSFEKQANNMISGLDSLIVKLRNAAEGTKDYEDALSALKNNYGEYVNITDKIVDSTDEETVSVNRLVDKYELLRQNITEAIRLKVSLDELLAKKDAASEKNRVNVSSSSKRAINKYINETFGIPNNTISSGYDQKVAEALGRKKRMFGTGSIESASKINERINNVSDRAWERYFNEKNYTSTNKDFLEIFSKELANEFVGNKFTDQFVEQLSNSVYNALDKGSGDYKKWVEASKLTMGKGTDLLSMGIRNRNLFKAINPGKNDGKTGIERQNWFTKQYSAALLSAFKDEFSKFVIEGKNDSQYNDVLNALGMDNADPGKVRAVAEATKKFLDTFNTAKDSSIRSIVAESINAFKEGTKDLTEQEVKLAGIIEKAETFNGIDMGRIGDFDPSTFVGRFNPYLLHNQSVQQTRDNIASEYSSYEKELKTYEDLNSEIFADDIKIIKSKMSVLKRLAEKDIYDVELDKKQKKGESEYDVELNGFLSNIRTAYDVYKKVTQAMGAQAGLDYMKNNEKMQERYFNLFHDGAQSATGQNIFKDENGNDIKIGKDGKTLRQVIQETQDVFIKEGLEEGVIDFEKAIRSIGMALKKYAQADEKTRKYFMTAANSYLNFADSIAKDNADAWIRRMNESIRNLGNDFKRSSEQVELYRKLLKNGTTQKLSSKISAEVAADSLTPDSILKLVQVKDMVRLYNEQGVKGRGGAGINLELGSMRSIEDIQKVIANVSKTMEMNRGAFGIDENGEFGKKIVQLLEEYLKAIVDELSSISGEQYTGDALKDAIANAFTQASVAKSRLTELQNIARAHGTTDESSDKQYNAIKEEQAQKVMDELIRRINMTTIGDTGIGFGTINVTDLEKKFGDVAKDIPEEFRLQFEKQFQKLVNSINKFNTSSLAFDPFTSGMKAYQGAHEQAQERYKEVYNQRSSVSNQANLAKLELSRANELGDPDKIAKAQQNYDSLTASVKEYDEELQKLGKDGEEYEKALKNKALEQMKTSMSNASSAIQLFSDAITGITDALSQAMEMVTMFTEATRDGETPEWMQEMNDFLGDFGKNFKALIGPIMAVIGAITVMTIAVVLLQDAATPLMITLGAIVAVAAIVAAVIAGIQAHDKKLERQIEHLKKRIEDLNNAAKNLNDMAKRMNGWKKLGTELEATGKSLQQYSDYLKMAELEEKKKHTDNDKVKEYRQSATEALNEFLNAMKDFNDSLIKSSSDWSDSISGAIRSAFKNGENAARAFKNVVNEMMGDIVEEMLKMRILEPLLEQAQNQLFGGTVEQLKDLYSYTNELGEKEFNSDAYMEHIQETLNDEGKMKQYSDAVTKAGYAYINGVNDLSETMKDWYAFNDASSALRSGIESITEDTARTLEALQVSMLTQLVSIGNNVGHMDGVVDAQMSAMRSTLVSIERYSSAIDRAIDQMRNGVRPMHVTID